MPVLVTGGSGLIGAALVRLLVDEARERPIVFDLKPPTRLFGDVADRIDEVRGDLANFSHVLEAVKKSRPRAIYHLGGMLSLGAEADPAAALRVNALGTFHVLEAARLFDVPQVLYSSTMATYGMDIHDDVIGDDTLQRPFLFYGATKLFGEHMGLFYRRKYGLDFRGIRYPAVVGPGVESAGIAQYISHVIEQCARNQPYTIRVEPETRHAFLYVKDAARAMVELARAKKEQIKTVNYVLAGIQPVPTAGQLAETVRKRLATAQIRFSPDDEAQLAIDRLDRPRSDVNAQREWGWQRQFDTEAMLDDFLAELTRHRDR